MQSAFRQAVYQKFKMESRQLGFALSETPPRSQVFRRNHASDANLLANKARDASVNADVRFFWARVFEALVMVEVSIVSIQQAYQQGYLTYSKTGDMVLQDAPLRDDMVQCTAYEAVISTKILETSRRPETSAAGNPETSAACNPETSAAGKWQFYTAKTVDIHGRASQVLLRNLLAPNAKAPVLQLLKFFSWREMQGTHAGFGVMPRVLQGHRILCSHFLGGYQGPSGHCGHEHPWHSDQASGHEISQDRREPAGSLSVQSCQFCQLNAFRVCFCDMLRKSGART